MIQLGLNERQLKAVKYIKQNGKITNSDYRQLLGISKRQVTNDLNDLEEREKGFVTVFDRTGKENKFPFVTISMAVILNDTKKLVHYGQLMAIAVELKNIAKQSGHSSYFVDRRKK